MTPKTTRFANVFALVALLGGPLVAQDQQVPTAEEVERIRAALPDKPSVAPGAPRRLLVMTQCTGFVHSSVPYGAKALELMGEKSGAFTVVVSDDPRTFEPDSLAGFDTVVMDNTTMKIPLVAIDLDKRTPAERQTLEAQEQRLRSGLLDFVRNGKGIVGIHAATDCFYDWPEYGEMMGGYFSGHPWSETVTVKLDDPGHPLLKAFKGSSFAVNDEIYQFREPYSRAALRVLLSLDTTQTNMAKGEAIRRQDDDFAVAWIREFGKGRVFYFSLGHQHAIFWTRPILQCYLDGIQYALGDLKADATPSAQLTAEYLDESRRAGETIGLDATFADFAAYRTGVDDSDAKRIADLTVEAQLPERSVLRFALEKRLVAVIARPDATVDCRQFACRQLSLIGTATAVPALAALLSDADSGQIARYALERIPGPEADQALLAALGGARDAALLGIINTLGVRRCAAALEPLSGYLRSPALPVATTAAGALGRIGTPASANALLAVLAQAATAAAVTDALLEAGERLAATVGPDQAACRAAAATVFAKVQEAAPAVYQRAAGFAGLMRLRGAAALPDILAVLRQERSALSVAAAALLPGLPGEAVAASVATALPAMPPAVQPLVLDALAARGDRAALPAVVTAAGSADATVQLRAVAALAVLGDQSTALLLARTAASAAPKSELQAGARDSLDRLRDDGADRVLEAALAAAAVPEQCEIIRALGARKALGAVPALLGTARSAERQVASQSLESLAQLTTTEHLPALVELLTQTTAASSLTKLEGIVVNVSRRSTDLDSGPRAVLAGLAGDIPLPARCSCIDVLGKLGRDSGLEALYAALGHADADVRKAAIKALADWPDAAPMDRLRQVGLEADNEAHRVLALRGYARQLALPSQRPMKETLQLYRDAFGMVKGDQERRSLLTGLGDIVHPDALALAKEYLGQETLQAEALLSAVKIMRGLDGAAMKLSASHSSGGEGLANAIDGTRATRWTSGRGQQGDEWFEIDLGYETEISEILLDAGDTGSDFPVEYRLFISPDRTQWGNPVREGKGETKVMTLKLPPTAGRYIRIEQTGKGGLYWSIAELQVNGRPEHLDQEKLKLDRSQWKVSAAPGSDAAALAIDGDIKTRWGTGRGQKPDDWFMVDLGQTKTLRRIVLDAAQSGGDYPRGYRVMISDDGQSWRGPIGIGGEEAKVLTVIPVLPTAGRYVKIIQTGEHENMWWSIYEMQIYAE
jgi:type 1 glutamine amidotransferase/HEAT repeat protein